MKLTDLDFPYPAELIATEPSRPTRVAWCEGVNPPVEITISGLLNKFREGDLLVVNESKVIPARIFSQENIEVLFLRALDDNKWQVLFPARNLDVGDTLSLPGDITLTLLEKGLPQLVQLSQGISYSYFTENGEMALPPYIQEARGQRHNLQTDNSWYQTDWATEPGSVAAPTASLHFRNEDLYFLKSRGVDIAKVTLHVGAGTFLPVRVADLSHHVMHEEWVHIPQTTLEHLATTRARGGRVWALGTTVARTLESQAQGMLSEINLGLVGHTNLFLYPPYKFQNVDVLMTNFHQPKSTLFALVAAFAGLERARQVYAWAIANQFRLFSYGDLSVWTKP